MAESALDTLRDQLPEVFKDRPIPADWDEDWFVFPSDPITDLLEPTDAQPGLNDSRSWPEENLFLPPDIPGDFPGGPQQPASGLSPVPHTPQPPTDCLAFYLPFHYFHPDWWGIYVILDGIEHVARYISAFSGSDVPWDSCWAAARTFLYSHEYFHFSVECFALRLEVSHRQPLYRTGFDRAFCRNAGTDDWREEALANGYALYKTRTSIQKGSPWTRPIVGALHDLVAYSPPGYRRGISFDDSAGRFRSERNRLAEEYFRESVPNSPSLETDIWENFGHAFRAFTTVNGRTNYIVRRSSSLAQRWRLSEHFVKRRVVERRLENVLGAKFVREGGRHTIWAGPTGEQVELPRHKEIKKGTVRGILKRAGWKGSLEEFLAA